MLHLPPTFLHRHPHRVRTPNLVAIPGERPEEEAGVDEVVAATEASQGTGLATLSMGRAMRSTPQQGAHGHHAYISTPAIASRAMATCAWHQTTTPTTTCDQQCGTDAQTAKLYLVEGNVIPKCVETLC